MNNRIRRVLASFQQGPDQFLAIASVMVVIGVILLITRVQWLQAVGTGVLGSGLAVIVSTLTSRRAIQEQYAKDANLRRKDLYAPLHAEMKKMSEYLDKAHTKDTPFPQHIDVGGDTDTASDRDLLVGYDNPTRTQSLALWSEYTTDYRRNYGFTEDSQRRFDSLRDHAVAYNAAVEEAREQSISILEPHIEAAIQRALADSTYQQEKKAHGGNPFGPSGEPASDKIERWIANLDQFRTTNPDPAKQWAWGWINNWGMQQPMTLGWLLAREPQRAAKHVHSIYRHDLSRNNPPLDWFEDIFKEAWPEFEQQPTYGKVWTSERVLSHAVRNAQSRLEEELRYIQQRFEGGPSRL